MYPGTTAAAHPNKPAVILHGTTTVLTYGELEEHANRLARAWHEAGLRRGDHIALLTDNDPRAFEVYWAAMRSGLYITAVNRHLTVDEIAYIVNDCMAKALIVAQPLANVAESLVPLTPGVQLRLIFDNPTLGQQFGQQSYEAFRNGASALPLPDRPRGADMLYSSGTTGRPKGIKPALPDAQVEDHAEPLITMAQSLWGFDHTTIYLSPAPVYHAAPLRTAAAVLALGGTVVLLKRFDAEESLRAIQEHEVTHSQWVPTMFIRMLKLDPKVRAQYALDSQRVAIHAAASCPIDVKREMIAWWGPILIEYYSSTESNGMTLVDTPEWLEHPGSVGKAVVGTIHICGPDGHEVPPEEVGTVYFERDELPFRYHGDDQKTASAQHPRHPTWSTTGDLGHVGTEGYLYLNDRQAFMIISGGVNIYPQEIENCLALHPAIEDVAVIGIPDPEMGEIVEACVVASQGHEPDDHLAQEILIHLGERIAAYKVPRGIRFVTSLPRTPTGKLIKSKLSVDDSDSRSVGASSRLSAGSDAVLTSTNPDKSR